MNSIDSINGMTHTEATKLRRRNPESLHESMQKINIKAKIVERMPSIKRVNRWIEDSQHIEIKVSS